MSITIPFTAEAAAELERRAVAAGTDVATFVLSAVQEKLAEREDVPENEPSYEEWSTQFHQWLSSHPSRNPHFDDSRDSIYD